MTANQEMIKFQPYIHERDQLGNLINDDNYTSLTPITAPKA